MNAVKKTLFRLPTIVSSTGTDKTNHSPPINISARDTHVNRLNEKIDDRRTRLLSSGMVSSKCLVCDVDTNNEKCLKEVHERLRQSSANRGAHLPSLQEIRSALSDRRAAYASSGVMSERHYCRARFMDVIHGSLHLVHPRCVHTCAIYQAGQNLEDIVFLKKMNFCALCQQEGATVSCYHPDCDKYFHVICAIFSNGQVNFGKRDPMLPCAACPSHCEVFIGGNRKRLRADSPEEIAFDSGDVRGMLRDPDDDAEDIEVDAQS
jgi:hypothetical protein